MQKGCVRKPSLLSLNMLYLSLHIVPSSRDFEVFWTLVVGIVFGHALDQRLLEDVDTLDGRDRSSNHNYEKHQQQEREVEEEEEPVFL